MVEFFDILEGVAYSDSGKDTDIYKYLKKKVPGAY